jgi:hypothetical protein
VFNTDNELDECALLDVVINYGCDEDDNTVKDFVWENM